PAFETVTTNPICEPALTGEIGRASGRERVGHWTTTWAVAGAGAVPLPKAAVAVLGISAQLADVVVATMWTEVDPAEARDCEANTRLPPVIDHPVDGVAIDQVRPAGSGSLTVTPVAVPGPAFETVTTNPICEPALTG